MKLYDSATDFMFAGEKLSDYNMMLCSFNGSSMENVSTGHVVSFNTISPPGSDRFYITHSAYEEPLSATFQICRQNHGSGLPLPLTPGEVSTLVRWLGCRDGFHPFRLYQRGYEDIFFRGAFSSIAEIKIGGKTCGLEMTFSTDSPYGYLDTVCLDFSTSALSEYVISNLSYEVGFLYPSVFQCKCLSAGNLQITNLGENRMCEIKNCSAGEVITLDGQNKIITGSKPSHKLHNDFNYNYFRLTNSRHGSANTIITSIPCEFHIEYNPIRKVGLG